MADLIDRYFTIHELEAFKESRSANLLRMSFDDVIDVVNGIRAVNCWISVHDVLPMEGMDVLVCNFDEWCGIASYHGDYWEDDQGRCVPAYAISHWQELPALPKREGLQWLI